MTEYNAMLHHIDCQFINMEKVSPVFYRKTEPFIPTHDNGSEPLPALALSRLFLGEVSAKWVEFEAIIDEKSDKCSLYKNGTCCK